MANIAENDRKEGIRTRQGFGELIKISARVRKTMPKKHFTQDFLKTFLST